MSVLVIVFAEVLPKTLAITSPDKRRAVPRRGRCRWVVALLGPLAIGHRAPRQAHAAALRHPHRRERADPLGHRGDCAARSICCTRRAASRRTSATCSAASSTSRPHGLGGDGPPHQDAHHQRGPLRREEIVREVLASPYTRLPLWRGQPGEHRRRAARQGPAARARRGRRRRRQAATRGDRARELVRARHDLAPRPAQGVPRPRRRTSPSSSTNTAR